MTPDLPAIDADLTLALNGSHSLLLDHLMLLMTETYAWLPFFVALVVVVFKNNSLRQTLVVLLAVALLICVCDRLCSGFVKPAVARWRPTQDPLLMYSVDVVKGYRGGRFGFYSGHANNTFALATFLALLFRYRPATVAVYAWAVLHTYTRLYLGVHYVGDVLVGALVGILFALLVYLLYAYVRRRLGDPPLVSLQFTSTGYQRIHLHGFLVVALLNVLMLLILAPIYGV